MTDPVHILPGDAPVLLTCEHASERFPHPWTWPEADVRLRGTHWAFDLGAWDLTHELAAKLGAGAVLANFSRLLADPNRPEDSPTLFREIAEGEPVTFNVGLDAEERERRLSQLYRPYHTAVAGVAAASKAEWMLSVHSFTPLYEGQPRAMELGVLFDTEEDAARDFGARVEAAGFVVAYNEPYSGREGLIYSVEKHAFATAKRPIEIELRQDLAVDPAARARLVDAIAAWFGHE